jgi:hypothetical protein
MIIIPRRCSSRRQSESSSHPRGSDACLVRRLLQSFLRLLLFLSVVLVAESNGEADKCADCPCAKRGEHPDDNWNSRDPDGSPMVPFGEGDALQPDLDDVNEPMTLYK